MNPNPVGAREYMPMIELNRLSGATAFRRMGTERAVGLANAMDQFDAARTELNEAVQVHRWAQRFLAQGVDTSFDERRFNQPGYQPVYGATPHSLPATPPNWAQLPLHAMYAQPADGGGLAPQLEHQLSLANTDAAEKIGQVQAAYAAVGQALEGWRRSIGDRPTGAAKGMNSRMLQAGTALNEQINHNITVHQGVDEALTMNAQRRQQEQAYPAPGIGLNQAPSPQFTPYPSPPQQATGVPMYGPSNYAQPNLGTQYPATVPPDRFSQPQLHPAQRARPRGQPPRAQSQSPTDRESGRQNGRRGRHG